MLPDLAILDLKLPFPNLRRIRSNNHTFHAIGFDGCSNVSSARRTSSSPRGKPSQTIVAILLATASGNGRVAGRVRLVRPRR